jgi:hypothetical protein
MENLSEMEDNEADRLDTAWDLTTSSRLGCQAVIKGDVVAEFPMYTRNYVQEGGASSSASPRPATRTGKRRRCAREMDRREDIGIALHEKFPDLDPLTVRFTDLREKVCNSTGSTTTRRPPTSRSSRRFRWPGTRNGRRTSDAPFSAPTHQDMLNIVTPQEFRSPVMDFSNLLRWLQNRSRDRNDSSR